MSDLEQPKAPEAIYDKFKAKLVELKDKIQDNTTLEAEKTQLQASFIEDLKEAKVPEAEHSQRWENLWQKILTAHSLVAIRDSKIETSLEQSNIDAFIKDPENLKALTIAGTPAGTEAANAEKKDEKPAEKISNFFTEKLGKIEEKLGWEPGTLASIFNGLPGLALAIRAFGAPKPGEKPGFFTVICENIANALDPVGAEGRKKLEAQKTKIADYFGDKKPNLSGIDKVENDLKGDPTKSYDKFEAIAKKAAEKDSPYQKILSAAEAGLAPNESITMTAEDIQKISNLDTNATAATALIERVLSDSDNDYKIDQTKAENVRTFLNTAYGLGPDPKKYAEILSNFKKPTVVAAATPTTPATPVVPVK